MVRKSCAGSNPVRRTCLLRGGMRAPACPKCGKKAVSAARKGADGAVKVWHYICPGRHRWSIISENRNYASLAHQARAWAL